MKRFISFASFACLLLVASLACSLPGLTGITPGAPTRTAGSAGVTPGTIATEALPTGAYDTGGGILTDLYISPGGDDGNDGLSTASPLRTLTAAWERIPAGEPLQGNGWRLNLLPGTYPCEPAELDDCRNAFFDRHGTDQFPITIRALEGPGTVTLRGGFDMGNLSYVYLEDLVLEAGGDLPTNQSGNNLLHLAAVDHVLLRGLVLAGPDCASDACNNLQEVLKVNQAQYLYLENNTIGGAWHSAVDFFAVQYGHVLNNDLHTAGQWCMYVKGGTASLRIEGNEFHDCQLGFQAGQSSNLPVMLSPWVHYEAYDIKFVNNLLHDIPGVGLSVSGGYDILLAFNTLYQVGTASDPGYPLFQVVQGERGCNPTDEIPDPLPVCGSILDSGGWGPGILTDNLQSIPSRSVYFLNNLVFNPSPSGTLYAHFYIAPPLDLPAGFQNLPDPVAVDEDLVISGNLIWNGPAGHPLGVDDTTGCGPSNPACNPAQLVQENSINQLEPQLIDPANGDYRPLPGGNVETVLTVPIPDFGWEVFTPAVPVGDLSNLVATDYLGTSRVQADIPGAFLPAGMP